ncbi:MAG: hypothetical protein IPG75_17375 [Gemmatimonadetes bacterium]|nr:hypothetical protein [Gemmatimonadota bacterium]
MPRLAGRWIEARHRLDARHQLLAETRAALAGLPRMEDSPGADRRHPRLAPRILTAGNAPPALGDLSGRLRSRAARHQVRLLAAAPLADSTAAGRLHRVRAAITLESDFRGLADFLAAIADDPVVLVAEQLGVTAADPGPTPVSRNACRRSYGSAPGTSRGRTNHDAESRW